MITISAGKANVVIPDKRKFMNAIYNMVIDQLEPEEAEVVRKWQAAEPDPEKAGVLGLEVHYSSRQLKALWLLEYWLGRRVHYAGGHPKILREFLEKHPEIYHPDFDAVWTTLLDMFRSGERVWLNK